MTGIETSKNRYLPFYKWSGAQYSTFMGNTTVVPKSVSIVGRQATTSTGNPHHLIGRTDRDIGSRFMTRKQFVTVDGIELNPFGNNESKIRTYSIEVNSGGVNQRYVGPRLARNVTPSIVDFYLPLVFSTTELNAAGTTAISRTIPTRPEANLAEFLGELREGSPRLIGHQLWESRIKDFRALGGEYLNYKFGWQSLVSDIREVFTAISDGDKILTQLERDSGKNVKRSYYFTPVRTVTSESANTASVLYPQLSTSLSPSGSMTKTTTNETKVWFKGCYTYYLSPKTRGRVAEIARKADHLLGLELTPEVLWNLTPWSWVADYFANIGDVMTNVSYFSQDNLLLRYGYIMREEKVTDEWTWTGLIPGYGSISTSIGAGSVTKQRLKATPYGFGLSTGGLNTSQWAILVALGIARAPKLL